MSKIFKPFIMLFKFIYRIIDKLIVTPISRLIYKIGEFNKENSGKIERLFNRPNILIYISLISAIAIFLLVDTKVINLKEKEAEVLSGQTITTIYNEEAYIVEGIPDDVDITLIGNSSAIYLATQLGDHNVTLDLSNYQAGTYKVKLKYNHSIQSVDYKLDPSTVTVKISEKVSDTRTLTYNIMNENKLDKKLSVSNVKLNTNEVVVKSSQEILSNVASVKALVDASQITLTESGEFTLENINLVAYDVNGNKISNVEIVPSKVSAVITIDSYNAVKSVKIVTEGNMTSGKAIESITSSVANVTVYGDKETVDALNYVEAKVNVDGISVDKNFSVDIIKPTGIRYISETKTNVAIKVGNESQRTIEGISIQVNNLGSDYVANATVDGDKTVDVILKGVSSVIDGDLSNISINAYVDLSGLKTGTYNVPVKVTVSDEKIKVQATKTEISVKISQK